MGLMGRMVLQQVTQTLSPWKQECTMGLPSLLLAQVSLITLLVLTTERLLRSSATLTVRISNRLSPPKANGQPSFTGAVRSRPSLDKGSEEVVALNVQQLFEVNGLISSPAPAQPASYAGAVKGRSPPLPSPGTSSDTFSEFFSVRTPSKQAKVFF